MSLGLVGRKIGMTRIFTEDGESVPVTVLDVSDNRVTQVKTPANDKYSAVQVAFGRRRAARVSKPEVGHFAKAGVEAGTLLKEFTVPVEIAAGLAPGHREVLAHGEAAKDAAPLRDRSAHPASPSKSAAPRLAPHS